MGAAHIPWRPLGRVLVEKGLLDDAQLERALDEQSTTGRRLGEILVRLGFITHSALSLALAEQYGFDLPTESGFGTGLRAQLERRSDADDQQNGRTSPISDEAPPTPAAARAPDALESQEAVPDPLPLAQLEEQWAKLAAVEERLAEAQRELEALRRVDERRRAQVLRLLGRIRSRRGRSVETPVTSPEAVAGHLLFVRLAGRYGLVERDGPPPAPDTRLELPHISEDVFVVTKVGPSPLPNDARPCAFTEALAHPQHTSLEIDRDDARDPGAP